MRNKLIAGAAIVGSAVAGAPAAAHHSFAAGFDASNPFTLTGQKLFAGSSQGAQQP